MFKKIARCLQGHTKTGTGLACLVLLALLAGCSTSEGSVEVAFQAARLGANAYETLPLCPAGDPCAKVEIVQKIHDASESAYSALIVARKAQTGDSLAAAQQAIATFQAVIDLPEVQAAIAKK